MRNELVNFESENNYVSLTLSFFFPLWPHLRHIEVPRIGVELELQLLAYTKARAMLELSASVTYAAVYGNTEFLTHWLRPGSPHPHGDYVGFLTHWATWGPSVDLMLYENKIVCFLLVLINFLLTFIASNIYFI